MLSQNPLLERTFIMTFTSELKGFAEASNKTILSVVKEVSVDLFTEIINKTPVGDPSLWKSAPPAGYVPGALRGNWQCTIETPALGRLGIRSGADAISSMVSVISKLGEDQAVYLANNLPYAQRIEFLGWSHSQSPAGMVRVSMSKIEQKLAEAITKVAA
jgi:hypothetical protein